MNDGDVVVAEGTPICRCGFDRDHHMVSRQPKYTFFGLIFVTILGITTEPVSLTFRCRRCQDVFGATTAPEDLRRYT